MNLFGTMVFYGWIPAIFLLFIVLPPRRAVIVSYLIGWLFIPPVSLPLPGLPDYTKVSATTVGVFLAALLVDTRRFLVLRPRLCDLPVIAWCVAPFCSSISNGLGSYDGLSESLNQSVQWLFPYLVGRAYFADLDGLREMAVAIVISGLVQVPLCLFELRMSPRLMQDVFGVGNWEGAMRFGAYRPRAFMFNGLSLGMWMTVSSLTAVWLWRTKVIRQMQGIGFGWWLSLLVVTTVLCRSTGALILLLMGVAAIHLSTRKAGRPWILWAMMATVPLYPALRASGLWSGEGAVKLTQQYIGPERAQSLEFRMINEDVLAERALIQPAFGWGGWDRMRTWNFRTDQITIPDGLWIIALGQNGLFGLASLVLVLLVPSALFLKRYPIRLWRRPDFAPAGVLAMVSILAAMDDLVNAQIIPIYTLFGAGLATLKVRPAGRAPAGSTREHFGVPAGAGPDPLRAQAEAMSRRAASLEAEGRLDQARLAGTSALEMRAALLGRDGTDRVARRDLAIEHERLGRILAGLGLRGEAEAVRRRALELWAGLEAQHPADPEALRHVVELQNDLAWAVVSGPGRASAEVQDALALARRAVDAAPEDAMLWNTLGAAHLRAGDFELAEAALSRSMALAPAPNAYDLTLMALTLALRNDPGPARDCLARAAALADRGRPEPPALALLRAEAEGALAHPAALP